MPRCRLGVMPAADVVDDRELCVGRRGVIGTLSGLRTVAIVVIIVVSGRSDLLAVDVVEQSHPVGPRSGRRAERCRMGGGWGGSRPADGMCRDGAAPAGVVGWVATDTVPTGFTFLRRFASTVTEVLHIVTLPPFGGRFSSKMLKYW